MTNAKEESLQIIRDERDMYKKRAEAAEEELRKWFGYVNHVRPDLKQTLRQRIKQFFHIGKKT